MFMAIQMWRKHTDGAKVIGERDRRSGWQLFLSSLTLTIGNPKVIVFFVSILPLVVDLKAMTLASFAEIFVVCAICLIAVLSGYVLAANGARALFQSALAMRNINRERREHHGRRGGGHRGAVSARGLELFRRWNIVSA